MCFLVREERENFLNQTRGRFIITQGLNQKTRDGGGGRGTNEEVCGGRTLVSRSRRGRRRERKVLDVKSRACFYAMPGD